MIRLIRRLIPNLAATSNTERLRACLGALVGLMITGFVTRAALGTTAALPLLIAPMGASAVLLFAVPASPLAQPWSIIGGNLVSALIGITAARFVAEPITAAALACACAIGAMFYLRCLHPPSGAVALTAVLGGSAVRAAGYGFAIWPVGVNGLLLLATALAFNNATGRRYPHLAPASPVGTPPVSIPERRGAFTEADLDLVLKRHDELIDVDRSDLAEILQEAEAEAYHRRFGDLICADIMSREVSTVSADMAVEDALMLLIGRHATALPVLSKDGLLLGIVTQGDVFRRMTPHKPSGPAARLFQHTIRFDLEPRTVGEIMTSPAHSAPPNMRIADLVPALSDLGLLHVPIVDEAGKLVGLLSQTQLIKALHDGHSCEKSGQREMVQSTADQPRDSIQRL